MNFTAEINIMPLKDLLDPAGKAVKSGLEKLGIHEVEDVRIGKHIRLQLNCRSQEEAKKIADEAVQKLLANPVMEQASVKIISSN